MTRKLVLDTNVVISGIIANGHSARILESCINSDDLIAVVSPDILAEYREKCNQMEAISVKARYSTIQNLKKKGELVHPEEDLHLVEDDPDDDKLFEAALEAGADYLVSGDKEHVQPIGSFREINVITPRELVEKME
ncbi:MAG: putative toxin-antitoxin system toxin component, PIN family [Candidatus Nanohaloarchaea archaeon]